MDLLSLAYVTRPIDSTPSADAHESGAAHRPTSVRELKRELAADLADLTLAVTAGTGGGLFGGSAALFGGMFAGPAGSLQALFTKSALIGDTSFYWLGSMSAIMANGAATFAEIDEAKLLVAQDFARERPETPFSILQTAAPTMLPRSRRSSR